MPRKKRGFVTVGNLFGRPGREKAPFICIFSLQQRPTVHEWGEH